ncbi:FG-GAP-like repeat-containing protein [Kitasatospora sp. NPDC127059]|uniref:FG-GAP-like repeat-containing protein n=1 Tax=unclassified Kitasatospora TaxID=2633591 RepID=UPI00364E249D
MLLTGLTFSVGQASAVSDPVAFQIQNKATGLCLQATTSWDPYQVEVNPCGSSDDQYFDVMNHNWFDDVAVSGGGSCLATDTHANVLSVACGQSGYTFSWPVPGVDGRWTPIASPAGCYLKLINNKTPACVPGGSGDDNAQWRMIRRHISHHNGTEAGNGRVKWADFWGKGKDDCITIGPTGAVTVWPNNGGVTGDGWDNWGQIASGLTTDVSRVRLADFTGDGKADFITTNPNGSVGVHRNDGGDGHGGWTNLGQVATGA